jgi:hypothetical protein
VFIAAWLGVGLLGALVVSVDPDLRWPLLQCGIAVAIIAAYMSVRYSRGYDALEFFDLGTLFVSIAFLYTFVPLANYVWRGGTFSNDADARMMMLQPAPETVTSVGWHYLLFMAGVATAYLAYQRHDKPRSTARPSPPRGDFLFWMIGLYATCQIVMIVLKVRYGLGAETYLESYRVYLDVPVFLQQSMAWLTGFSRVVEIGILACFYSRYQRYRVAAWAWIAAVAIATFLRLHARTDLMIAVGSSLFLYHVFVRQVRLGRLAVVGVITVTAFQALGVLRGLGGDVDAMGTHELLNSGSEFEAIFGNAVHILTMRDSGQGLLPRYVWYLNEVSILIPQQLLPFTKIDPATWYVRSFFPRYADMGGGFAWGSIAQSIVGFGLPEAALRGVLLGALLASFNRYLRARWSNFQYVVVYAWMMATVYLSMRNVTFYFIHGLVYMVAPWLVACHAIQRSVNRAGPIGGTDPASGSLADDTGAFALRRAGRPPTG